MRKSKYLILVSLFFKFSNDLTKVYNTKLLFKKQDIIDITRFNKLQLYNLNLVKYNVRIVVFIINSNGKVEVSISK